MLRALGRFKPQSASVRNVLKLAGGTAGSQVITVAASPILTRLYGPESFGVITIFASIFALLNVVSSLRYELAISVPEEDDEAVALVWLCFGLVAISTCLTALGVLLLSDQLVDRLDKPALKPLMWLLPIGVLLNGVYQPLSYWAIRCHHFSLLAQTKFRQSIISVFTNLVAAPLGTIGLLLGQIVSQVTGIIEILRQSLALLSRPTVNPAVIVRTMRRYSRFGIYSTPGGVISTIGNQVPNLIFASAFGAAELGQLALAQRLLLLPAGLISTSVGQVFLSQASVRYRSGTLPALIRQASRKLLLYGLAVAAVVCLGLAPLIPVIFGQKWEPTRWIILLLMPLFLGQMSVSPMSMGFVAAEKNFLDLMGDLTLMLVRILPLALFGVFGFPGFYSSLAIYSLFSGLGYFLLWRLLIASTRQ